MIIARATIRVLMSVVLVLAIASVMMSQTKSLLMNKENGNGIGVC